MNTDRKFELDGTYEIICDRPCGGSKSISILDGKYPLIALNKDGKKVDEVPVCDADNSTTIDGVTVTPFNTNVKLNRLRACPLVAELQEVTLVEKES